MDAPNPEAAVARNQSPTDSDFARFTDDKSLLQILPLLLVLMFAELTCAFETSLVLAGIEAWVRISGEPVTAGWLVTGYLLVAASSSALCGRLGDLFGRREMLALVLGLCALGSAVGAFGPSLGWVIAGRALQGLSGAIIPLVYALARERFPARHLPSCIGAIVATAAAGAAIGLLVGGVLSDHFGPQSVFMASLVMTTFGVVLTLWRIAPIERDPPPRQLDVLGGALLAPAIAGLLLAISNVKSIGVGSAWVIAPAAVGATLLAVWVWQERRHPDPLIDIRLLVEREVLLGNLIMACLAVGSFQATLLMALLIQQPSATGGLGVDATMVGIVKFPAMIAGLGASLWAGRAAGRHGPRRPVMIGTAVASAGLLLALFFRSTLLEVGIIVLIINCGLLSAYAGIPMVILSAMPPGRTGEATGMMSAARFIFSGAGAQLLVVLLALRTVQIDGVVYPDDAAFTIAIAFMLASSAAAVALACLLRRSPVAPGRHENR